MTDTPDPDLQRIIEAMAPPEDSGIYIDDPTPELRELVEITQTLNDDDVRTLLQRARWLRQHRP